MPSRRALLGSVGSGVSLALAGCLNRARRVEAYVQFKLIDGVIAESGRRREVPVVEVDASYENGTPPELVHLDEEWADRFPVPRRPVVPESLHGALADRFDAVRYVVGATSPAWAEGEESLGSFNVATTREKFNRVQVHTAMTASSDGTYLTVHSVDGLWEFDRDDR